MSEIVRKSILDLFPSLKVFAKQDKNGRTVLLTKIIYTSEEDFKSKVSLHKIMMMIIIINIIINNNTNNNEINP